MKQLKIIALFGLITYTVCSCNDDLTNVGSTIQPPGDLITVYADTFMMKASTVKLDSVFAKTSDCLLGELYDPTYGYVKSDFLCQFYCEEGMKFNYEPYNGKVDSVDLYIYYSANSWYGDTLTPMQVTVYPIDKPLKRNFYSNDNPEAYCDMQNPLGVATYTAYDMSVSDSIHQLPSTDYNYYTPFIRIKMPTELGQRLYDKSVDGAGFASQSAFNDAFPGVYVTNTYGNGSLIATATSNIAMVVHYTHAITGSEGQDSLIYAGQTFSVSKEVIQLNHFKNGNLDQLLTPNPDYTYIKSPAGVCTKLVIPTTEIAKKLDVTDRYINAFSLSLRYLPADEWDFAYSPPSYLLVLPEDSVKTFFEEGRTELENSQTAFLSYYQSSTDGRGYSPYTRTYNFGNVSSLLKAHIANSPDKDLSLLAIPVKRSTMSYQESSYSSTLLYRTISIYNEHLPSGIKIQTGDAQMKIVVLSSKFEEK